MKPKAKASQAPDFASEREEAAWWDKHADEFHEDVIAQGQYKPGLKLRRTKPVTIRLAEADVELAKTLAVRSGVPYQTLMKELLHEALKRKSA
ncbi:MAG: BrnA antitoxin family protein [Bryobacterales bacterium]|nr:BrnA antitoxin family protein [Bryobacterales bacterium]